MTRLYNINSGAIRMLPKLIEIQDVVAPFVLLDIEMAEELCDLGPFSHSEDGASPQSAMVLVRFKTEPLGVIYLRFTEDAISSEDMGTVLRERFECEIDARRRGRPDYLAVRSEVLKDAPSITVGICTRERPEEVRKCLESVLAQAYPNFSVIVVDTPETQRTHAVVDSFGDRVQYLEEKRPGLSFARNLALEHVQSDIMAWIDDDEIADRHWLAELARAFHDVPTADVVCGLILPAELDTHAQVLWEQYGGHSKLRGFTQDVFSKGTLRDQSPYYPLPPFGCAANSAFRLKSLLRLGGFDPALGVGTPTMAGEDTRALTEILCNGGTIVHQPSALLFHHHRRDLETMAEHRFGYGVGLTAYYTSLIMDRPSRLIPLVRLLPLVYRDFFTKGSLRTGTLPAEFPPEIDKANRKGLLIGPLRYVKARRQARLHGRPTDVWRTKREPVRS